MKRPVPASGLGHLRIVLDENFYIGPGRADLLEGIERTGSISAAGKAMSMSYKRAWSLVQALNDGAGTPLVETIRGGTAQGGAHLTEAGREILARYRAMQEKTGAAIEPDVEAMRALVKPANPKP
ncbi:winged helix-turn-helix domain-containing protein [Pelagibacterium halotolerans]|uniref:DNA-binding domain of ModE n=1 Tax=Pelagibacterium halotolerans (strain DSM 22347 / JCM 15775 / CGMCC 1.7692 / B2) TaxID=1082931 RepID=G4RCV4_PELHB|nr:winged helix-turn-helix domain-containing protein [Pelagibacterium halotolerans]AEQ52737.1 DNA-binding domain of ModE [Pelagibacterium halotolerans B2]QJR17561.1 LysR family transcriptional regulator [Pelagibacterium halotolerans]SEA85252.1 molybdate transport system regulatory protein [Pelagibacterium halotolerans]